MQVVVKKALVVAQEKETGAEEIKVIIQKERNKTGNN